MTTEVAEPASKIDLAESTAGEIPSFDITLKVRRYNPEISDEAHWDEWTLTMYGTDRVLDALHKVKWEHDGTVSFRRSCAHGVCGSDAMRINGRNRLACKTLLKDLDTSKPILVEPIKGLPVEKDLIVDMEPFFQSFRRRCIGHSLQLQEHLLFAQQMGGHFFLGEETFQFLFFGFGGFGVVVTLQQLVDSICIHSS